MVRRNAKKELANVLAGTKFWINTKMDGARRFYHGERNSLFISENGRPQMVIPQIADSSDDYSKLKTMFKKLKEADDFNIPYVDNKKTKCMPYNTVAVGNRNCLMGEFFHYDHRKFLTDNLLNILAVIRKHEHIEKDFGILTKDIEWYIKRTDAPRTAMVRVDAIKDVYEWLQRNKIESWHNLRDGGFKYDRKGLLIKDKDEYHFVKVSDGTDRDLVSQYLDLADIRQKVGKDKPQLKSNDITISSVVLASPYSKHGFLFRDDQKEVHGQTLTHDNPDYLPDYEFFKTFLFSRLPFYLGYNYRPVNMLLSSTLRHEKPSPEMSMMYFSSNGPLHKYHKISRSIS